MASAVAAIAVQLAGVLQQRVSGDVFIPEAADWAYMFSTKTWYGSSNDGHYSGTCGGATMGTLWPHLGRRKAGCDPWVRGSQGCACADIRQLVLTAFGLFQTLTAKAKQAGTSAEGADVLLLISVCCFAEMHVYSSGGFDALAALCMCQYINDTLSYSWTVSVAAHVKTLPKGIWAIGLLLGCMHFG